MCEICSNLTIKVQRQGQYEDISHFFFGVSIVDSEQVNVEWE